MPWGGAGTDTGAARSAEPAHARTPRSRPSRRADRTVGAATFAVVPAITQTTSRTSVPETRSSGSCHVPVARKIAEVSHRCTRYSSFSRASWKGGRKVLCVASREKSPESADCIARSASREAPSPRVKSRDFLAFREMRAIGKPRVTSRARCLTARWRPFPVDSRWAAGRRARAPSPTPSRCTP